jgi:hypothetical protein
MQQPSFFLDPTAGSTAAGKMASQLVTSISSVPVTESRAVPLDLDSKLPQPGEACHC